MELENKNLCARCKGLCCKQTGCTYDSRDFLDLNKEKILELLKTGRISISANFDIEKNILLFLRARNVGKPIVDLISLDSPCINLTPDGCLYDFKNRPSSGRNLVPKANFCCDFDGNISYEDILNSWLPYQLILQEIVYLYTSLSPIELFKKQVDETFKDALIKLGNPTYEESIYHFLNLPFLKYFEKDKTLTRKS